MKMEIRRLFPGDDALVMRVAEEAWVGTKPDNVAARALYEVRKEPHGLAEEFLMYVYEL
jgi:hypothetical protein